MSELNSTNTYTIKASKRSKGKTIVSSYLIEALLAFRSLKYWEEYFGWYDESLEKIFGHPVKKELVIKHYASSKGEQKLIKELKVMDTDFPGFLILKNNKVIVDSIGEEGKEGVDFD